jgi:hypothetical protein
LSGRRIVLSGSQRRQDEHARQARDCAYAWISHRHPSRQLVELDSAEHMLDRTGGQRAVMTDAATTTG